MNTRNIRNREGVGVPPGAADFDSYIMKMRRRYRGFQRFQKMRSKDDFAEQVFIDSRVRMVKKKDGPSSDSILHDMMVGTLGGVSADPYLTELGEEFVKTGRLSREFVMSAKASYNNASKNNPESLKKAKLQVVNKLINTLSGMEAVKGDFVFIDDLLKVALNDNGTDLRTSMTEDDRQVLKGIDEIANIVVDGFNSWNKLANSEDGQTADYAEHIQNFMAMRTLEAEMKKFAHTRSNENENNRIFHIFGETENSGSMLKETIRKSKCYQSLLDSPLDKVVALATNTNDQLESGFEKLMEQVMKKTFGKTGLEAAGKVEKIPAKEMPLKQASL